MNSKWTPEELELLKKHYGTMTAKKLQTRFMPGHTIESIRQTAYTMRVTKQTGHTSHVNSPTYNEAEIQYIKNHYTGKPKSAKAIAEITGRTHRAIQAKVQKLGIATPQAQKQWSAKEDQLLKQYYGKMQIEDLIRTHMPNRSKMAVYRRACTLGLTHKQSKTKGG